MRRIPINAVRAVVFLAVAIGWALGSAFPMIRVNPVTLIIPAWMPQIVCHLAVLAGLMSAAAGLVLVFVEMCCKIARYYGIWEVVVRELVKNIRRKEPEE